MSEIIPYSQHFRCYRQMIKGTVTQAVLEFIADEHMALVRKGRSGEFILKPQYIVNNTGIKWETVTTHVKKLEGMGLITIDEGDICQFHEDVFVSLCAAFVKLSKIGDRKKFADALEAGDQGTLESLGYGLIQNWRDLSKNGEGSPILDKVLQNRIELSKNGDISPKLDKFSRTILSKIGEIYPKMEMFSIFLDELSSIFGEEEAVKAINDIYSGEPLTFKPIYFQILGVLVMENLSKNGEVPLQNWRYKININKREVTSLSSTEEIEDNQEKEEILETEVSVDSDENFPAVKFTSKSYERKKKISRLPFYSREDVDLFLTSPDMIVDDPYKIFVFQVWTILEEMMLEVAVDSEGNTRDIPVSPEGKVWPIADLNRMVLVPALEAVCECQEKGYLECTKGKFPVSFEMPDLENFDDIIGWERAGEEEMVISKSRFVNLRGEVLDDSQSSKPRRGTEDHEKNEAYFQSLIRLGQEGGDDLTDIEVAVYVFLSEFYLINEDCTVDDVDVERLGKRFVDKISLHQFLTSISKDYGISRDDFLSVVNREKVDPSGNLNLRRRMFSLEKIEEWNKRHGQTSRIFTNKTKV